KECNTLSSCAFLKFAVFSTIFGFLCVLVDFLIFKLNQSSYLKIKYITGFYPVFLFWTLGSLIVGYIGAAAHLLEVNIFSALVVSVGWQLIFARWVAGKFEEEDSQPP